MTSASSLTSLRFFSVKKEFYIPYGTWYIKTMYFILFHYLFFVLRIK